MKGVVSKLSRTIIGVGLVAGILYGCASKGAITGGPVDAVPPTVFKTTPELNMLNFQGKEVEIIFDEPIKKPTYGKEIFISPLPDKRPKIIQSDNGKKIRIVFSDPLAPQTTYVFTLNSIQDNNAGVEMEVPYTLAFSTGDALDSMQISGQIYAPIVSKGTLGMMVMLFDADSVREDSFFQRRPYYISISDSSGKFSFSYLRRSPYKIYGVLDGDQSYTYNSLDEPIALAESPIVNFDDSLSDTDLKLYAFKPDTKPPLYKSSDWVNDSVWSVKFTERFFSDSISVFYVDTTGKPIDTLDTYTFLGGSEQELLIYAGKKTVSPRFLRITSLIDSLGNKEDTTLRLGGGKNRFLETPLLKAPAFDLENQRIRFYSSWPLDILDTLSIFVSDTVTTRGAKKTDSTFNGKSLVPKIPYVNRVSVPIQKAGFLGEILFKGKMTPGKPYLLHISGKYLGDPDTTYQYPIQLPVAEKFGTLAGTLKLRGYKGPIVAYLKKEKTTIRTIYDTTFAFTFLEPAGYQFEVVLDSDGNKTWTPGSLRPYKLPEKRVLQSVATAVRANWEVEEEEVPIDAEKPIPDRIRSSAKPTDKAGEKASQKKEQKPKQKKPGK